MRTGQWKGKVKFEDFVTNQLFQMNENLEETNRLLRKLAGEIEPDNRSLKDKALDLLDDGKINKSNVKKFGRKNKK